MAGAVLPQTSRQVLDDGDEGLLPKAEIKDDEEVVDLNKGDSTPAAAPAVPAAKQETLPAKKQEAPAPAPAEDDDLPPELKGKSQKELAKMYREAQSLIGRQGSELGDLRRHADLAIQIALEQRKRDAAAAPAKPAEPAAPATVDETEFFRSPNDAIAKAIASHPTIKKIEETLGKSAKEQATSRMESAATRFASAHPDAGEIMQDPEFRQWVGASRVRQNLLLQAHRNYDFDAGDEVFGTWKALKGAGKPAPAAAAAPADDGAAAASEAARVLSAQAKKKRDRDLAAAGVPTGGGAGGTAPSGSKKIYRRADVLKLMSEDPERYEQLAPEIEQAYREKRVR